MRAMLVALVLVATFASGTASARERQTTENEVEILAREVRALKEELRKLKAAMSEAAELTRRSADTLARSAGGPDTTRRSARPRQGKAATTRSRASKTRGTIRGTVRVPKGEPIAYAYVENVYAPPVKGRKVVIDQKDKHFIPSWAVVRRGTKVEFPNLDNIHHNVFSPSAGNTFDLGLYSAGAPAKTHAFKTAGAADIYCNIHPKMAASILVVPNRYFAKVKPDGSFVIPNVPSGHRKLVAWSPGSRPAVAWVELARGGAAKVKLALQPKSAAHKDKTGRAYGSYP